MDLVTFKRADTGRKVGINPEHVIATEQVPDHGFQPITRVAMRSEEEGLKMILVEGEYEDVRKKLVRPWAP